MPAPTRTLPSSRGDNAATRRLWRALLVFGLALAAVLALGPRAEALGGAGMDKLQHAAAFAALAMAAALAFAPSARHDALVATGLLAYGVLIEAAQLFVPGRTASLADVAADAVGIALGLALARLWRRVAVPARHR